MSSGDPDECPPTSSHPLYQSQMLRASMSDHESGESSGLILHQSHRSQLVFLRDSSNTESIMFNFEAIKDTLFQFIEVSIAFFNNLWMNDRHQWSAGLPELRVV